MGRDALKVERSNRGERWVDGLGHAKGWAGGWCWRAVFGEGKGVEESRSERNVCPPPLRAVRMALTYIQKERLSGYLHIRLGKSAKSAM